MSDWAAIMFIIVPLIVIFVVLVAAVLFVLVANMSGAMSYRWMNATPIGRRVGVVVVAVAVCTVSIRASANDSVWELVLNLPGILMSGFSATRLASWIERRKLSNEAG